MSELNNTPNYKALMEAYEDQTTVPATVIETVPQGFQVDVFGVKSFLPGSATRDKRSLHEGSIVDVVIWKVNPLMDNIVVSNRIVEDARDEEKAEAVLKELEVGDIVEGVVKNITSYGAFISVNGLDGLVHSNDISWSRFKSVADVLEVGQTVTVKVKSIETAKGKTRVAFSIKDVAGNPWDSVKEEDYLGHVVEGTVSNVSDYGAFVAIGPIEGLLHQSEISWGRPKSPRDLFTVGQKLTVKVISFDKEAKKMAVSLRQVGNDPWDSVDESIVGKTYEGTVTNIVNFGAFVEILPDVEGLVHVSDLTTGLVEAEAYTSVGSKMLVKVVEINKDKKKLGLSHKAMIADPWLTLDTNSLVGKVFDGKVVYNKRKNAITVMLDDDLFGTLTNNRLPAEFQSSPKDFRKIGEPVRVSVEGVDPIKRIIYVDLAE